MSRDETRSWAECEIDKANRVADEARRIIEDSQLRMKRLCVVLNSTTSINQLPDELLVEILRYVHPGTSNLDLKQLIRATHVCQRWRVIALNAPLLWAAIRFDIHHRTRRIDAAEMCMQRSRDALLHVNIDQDAFNLAMRLLYAEDHRIASLRLESRTGKYELSRIAPRLNSMTILDTLEMTIRSFRSEVGLYLPSQCTQLRRIWMENVRLRVSTPLTSLNRLELSTPVEDLAGWLSLMKNCPNLEFLSLEQTRLSLQPPAFEPEDSSDEGRVHRRQVMCNLRTLKLRLDLDCMSVIFQRMVFPQTTRITLTVNSVSRIPSVVASTIAVIRQMSTFDTLVSSTQSMHVMGMLDIKLYAWSTPDGSGEPLLRLTVPNLPTRPGQTALAMRQITEPLASSPLTFLSLDPTWNDGLDAPTYLELLCRYPLLQELRVIYEYSVFPVLAALRGTVATSGGVVCVELKILRIVPLDLVETAKEVLDLLQYRSMRGSRLRELHFIGSHESIVDAAVKEQLRGLVDVFGFSDGGNSLFYWQVCLQPSYL
ncbi:hypothetical protein EVJ58_g3881 [Rhodofomes roseus]|uniref:F-box domain-containing protein n=1 Tax=Rhodofomes roseus TaxID=34475 RepID=A0A4Y9YIQ1_9APHY|nr:hypothetical protein EVJ58_g3881 [Rhodofomes roseus]